MRGQEEMEYFIKMGRHVYRVSKQIMKDDLPYTGFDVICMNVYKVHQINLACFQGDSHRICGFVIHITGHLNVYHRVTVLYQFICVYCLKCWLQQY